MSFLKKNIYSKSFPSHQIPQYSPIVWLNINKKILEIPQSTSDSSLSLSFIPTDASIIDGGFTAKPIQEPWGLWSSDNEAICTIDEITGEVTGVSPGTTTVTFTTRKLNSNTNFSLPGNNTYGIAIRWRNLPDLTSTDTIELLKGFNPKIIRYPGGAVTHKWDWQTGQTVDGLGTDDTTHLIGDVKLLADALGSEVIFVLDILNSSLQNQIDMLNAANVPIKYIELGNELYLTDYDSDYPTGVDYANACNTWIPTLRTEFPDAKIGVCMIGRTGNAQRQLDWNQDIVDTILPVDAHIYHIYISEGETVEERIDRFKEQWIDRNKEIWVTEYNDSNYNFKNVMKLEEIIDKFATIRTNHTSVSGSGQFSKITLTGDDYTSEGIPYIQKYNEKYNGIDDIGLSVSCTVTVT